MGVEVALFPTGNPACDPEHVPVVKEALSQRDMFFHDAPSLRIWHQFDMGQHVGRGPLCGFPIFELEDFNEVEKHNLRYLDKIFVTSAWARNVVLENLEYQGVYASQVIVAPLGVDTRIFHPEPKKSGPTVFMNVGKWEERKGHSHLIEAFTLAFEEDDKVELWMMCDNPFCDNSERNQWEKLYRSHPKVKLIPRVETHPEVAALMNQADCGVFPSHAEGWNLDALEMMACGKHIIISNCTAHTDFCNPLNSHLIDMGPLEDAFDGKWFLNQGRWKSWGIEQRDQLITYLRSVHKQVQNGDRFNKPGWITAKDFTWKRTAEAICTGIQT